MSFVYYCLLALHDTLSNPLGCDPCDFPSLAYQVARAPCCGPSHFQRSSVKCDDE